MSIKDLFDKGYSSKSIKNKNQEEIREDVESQRYLDGYAVKSNRFLPDVDFTTASNFARYGLAELYYENSIKRVYQTYPYDGSQAEKIEWENESTYLDLFIFDNEYPRTNGYININPSLNTFAGASVNNIYSSSLPQYVLLYGGPHADPGGDYKSEFSAGSSKKGVSKANIYDTGSQRTNNLEIDLEKGLTIEFWMKKDGWHQDSSAYEYIFSNQVTASSMPYVSYTSIRINPSATSTISFEVVSGSESGTTGVGVSLNTSLTNIADGEWHHYAVTAKSQDTKTLINMYVDGKGTDKKLENADINAITGSLIAAIGALPAARDAGPGQGPRYGPGWGNIVSASFDEFRYWKTDRDAQQIGRYFIDHVGGGTNTDNIKYDDVSNKVDLGVYYKFNEGITGDSNTDSTILDYSGRISNGTFINYNSSESRNIGSAIVSASAAAYEFKDPIIYSHHPDVITLLENKKISGSMHDGQNFFSIYHSLPSWILEEDEKKSHHLKFLTQIIASYFDSMFLEIQKLPRLKDINYPYDSDYERPLPFADKLLSSRGYNVPELFADAHMLAKYLQRDERTLFEKKLYEVKNTIYQNIYNNLSFINKSKGTLKSLRNFLRCFGVDEELIRLNIYSDNGEYEFKDNFTNKSYIKKYLDFDDAETRYSLEGNRLNAYAATAYQYVNPEDSNSLSYIPARTNMISGSSFTLETEVIFPKRTIKGDSNYQLFPATTASIFGLHAVDKALIEADSTDMTFASTDDINFTIGVSKPHDDKRNVKFIIMSSDASVITSKESDLFTGVYDNEKWNLAFSVFPKKYPLAPRVTGSLDGDYPYSYELYGVNYVSNTIQDEFTLNGDLTLEQGLKFFRKPKSIFIGAERTNFSGSVDKISDVKISSVRYWMEKLDKKAVQGHAQDAGNIGTLRPYQNRNLHYVSGGFHPQLKTLAMHWSMDNVTGSNANGRFLIYDTISGSINDRKKPRYPGLSEVSEYSYPGRGDFFVASTEQAVDLEFVPTGRQKLPEIVNSDDMVRVLNKYDDVVFKKDNSYVNHVLSVEKSMYQTISEEMLKMFSTIVDFNNLIGEPINRYRSRYKVMEKLRDSFFRDVENEPDLEKFLEFYKWLDDAVTLMIEQLLPVSSNSTKLLRNMVESHILERNKYWFKFPTLEAEPPKIVGTLRGIEELNYSWKFGHAPVNPNQNTNQDTSCLWWNQRAERSGSASGQAVLTSGDIHLDSDKAVILKRMVTEVSGSTAMLRTSAGTKYGKGYYPIRSLGRVVEFKSERTTLDFKGGSNPNQTNKHDFYKGVIKWGSDDDFIFIDVDNEIKSKACNDQITPLETTKKKFNVKALTMRAHATLGSNAMGTGINDKTAEDSKASLLVPMSIHSSSIDTGYRNLYPFGVDFTNLHDDKYGFDAEIPMQGPFSRQHVGGNQHRHVKLNQGADTPLTRPEGWHLEGYLDLSSTENILLEHFSNATTTATTDISILNLPIGSEQGDPSLYEYWSNGVGTDNLWSFIKGPTPSPGTGPAGGRAAAPAGSAPSAADPYAYCEVAPSMVGQTFGLVTPLIDLLDVSKESKVRFYFRYHMHGLGIGNLRVQASGDPKFITDVKDLHVRWSSLGSTTSPAAGSTVLSGQQHANSSDNWSTAIISSEDTYGSGLREYLGTRFYIRFLYTAGISHLGDCAIDYVQMYKYHAGGGAKQNSFKLLHPTYDIHNRPHATLTREEYAKRPLNIRNIEITGSSPTRAGNYHNRYEYVNTVSPESNDPFFVKNQDQINSLYPENITIGKIENLLDTPAGQARGTIGKDFMLPNRSFLSGNIKNKTRIMTRFSSPGGFETLTRGFLDPAHETYSVYNATTYKNLSARTIYNTQLQAHQGKFGISTHQQTTQASVGYMVFNTATISLYNGKSFKIFDGSETFTFTVNNTLNSGSGGVLSPGSRTIEFGLTNASSITEVKNCFLAAISQATRGGNIPILAPGTVPVWNLQVKPYNENPRTGASLGNHFYIENLIPGHHGAFMMENIDHTQVTFFNDSIYEGKLSTARVYGTEVTGTISALDYKPRVAVGYAGIYPGGFTISPLGPGGGASAHKYHRNNIKRMRYVGDHSEDARGSNPVFITGSLYDNGFVSHMIPRTDQQTRWITASII